MTQATTKVFVSYKTGPDTGLTFQARAIKKELEAWPDSDYEVFFDKDNIEAGLDWNKQIYDNIPTSDILLLLLAPETAGSDWVRREIDVAKGARVTILPVLIRGDFDLQAALDKFDIARVQAVKLLEGNQVEYESLITSIEQRKDDTEDAQRAMLEKAGRVPQSQPVASSNPDYQVYPRDPNASPKIHLAAGDIMELGQIDVYVNAENDYMQMARVFDDTTISSNLRFHGSHFDGANRLLDDTVQNELSENVKHLYTTRPLGLGTVVVTSAGHIESDLVKRRRARYIFHTACVSVQGDGARKHLVPIQTDLVMKAAVRSALDMVRTVDAEKGVVSRPGRDARISQQKLADNSAYEPIKSIVFPIFGTGRGGRRVSKVAPLVARSIKEFTLDEPDTSLEHIYVSAYTEEDVATVDDALKAQFAPDEVEND